MSESTRKAEQAERTIAEVTDSFVSRLRKGERPSIGEYKARYPHLSAEIDEVFPALEVLEQVDPHQAHPKLAVNDSIPQQLGEYQIIQEIGRGGMGIVFEARHATMQRRVALKVLPKSAADKPMYRSRFVREARAAGQLHHTNIVPVFEVGEASGLHYYSMQFIHGQNLDLVMDEIRRLRATSAAGESDDKQRTARTDESHANGRKRSTTLSESVALQMVGLEPAGNAVAQIDFASAQEPKTSVSNLPAPSSRASASAEQREAAGLSDSIFSTSDASASQGTRGIYFRRVAAIGVQVADALDYAHHHGVLHRDIKPANLILDTEGTVWVTDFGLAKPDEDALTHTGDIVGTLRYMAPERFGGESDPRSDVYSLGLTLYELATLRYAFDEVDRAVLVQSVSARSPTPPRRIDANIPRDLETIILKSIESQPERRYRTARQLADDLQSFLADRPIQARRISATERLWRICRRNPLPAALAGCVALLLALVAIVSLLFAAASARHADDLRAETAKARRAETAAVGAHRESQRNLYKSYLAQARTGRLSRRQGQYFDTIESIREATGLLGELDLAPGQLAEQKLALRREAIAAMALVDVRDERVWETRKPWLARVTFDADYERYAQCDEQGNIRVCRADNDRQLAWIPSPGAMAWWMKINGRYLASSHHERDAPPPDRKLYLWDLERRGEPILVVPGTFDFDLSGEPLRLACTTSKGVEIRPLDDPGAVTSIPLDFYPAMVRLPDAGDKVAVAEFDGGNIQIWDFADGPMLLSEDTIKDGIRSLSWLPERSVLAVGTREGNIHSWRGDLSDEPQRNGVHRHTITDLHIHPRGNSVISYAWDRTVRVTDLATGAQSLRVEGAKLLPVGFGRDGRSIGFERTDTFGVWRLSEPALTVLSSGVVDTKGTFARFHPAHPRIAARSSNQGIEFWDVTRGQLVFVLDSPRNLFFRFSPAGRHLFTSGRGGLRRWPLEVHESADGQVSLAVGEPKTLVGKPTRRLDVSTSGDAIAVGVGSAARLLDAETGRVLTQFGKHPRLERVGLTCDGRWLLTGTWKGYGACVWNAETGELAKKLLADTYSVQVTAHPTDPLGFATFGDGKLLVWRMGQWDTPQMVRDVESDVCYSADGRRMATSPTPYVTRLLDPSTGRTLAVLESPNAERRLNFDFSTDASRLALACDENLQVWDLAALRRQLAALGLDWE